MQHTNRTNYTRLFRGSRNWNMTLVLWGLPSLCASRTHAHLETVICSDKQHEICAAIVHAHELHVAPWLLGAQTVGNHPGLFRPPVRCFHCFHQFKIFQYIQLYIQLANNYWCSFAQEAHRPLHTLQIHTIFSYAAFLPRLNLLVAGTMRW